MVVINCGVPGDYGRSLEKGLVLREQQLKVDNTERGLNIMARIELYLGKRVSNRFDNYSQDDFDRDWASMERCLLE